MMTPRDLLWLGGGIAAGVALAVGFPKLRRHLEPVFAEASQRAGNVFSSLAETVATQMERAEDAAAQSRSAG